jgi:mRNA interferase MazF
VWWATFAAPDKTRPVVLVSREDAYPRRSRFTVAPVTSRIRRIRTHVAVGCREGLERDGEVNCDAVITIDRETLIERIGALDPSTLAEVDDALRFSLGLD